MKPETAKGKIPRLNQCWICKRFYLEKVLSPIEIPSQGSEYVQKLACQKCLDGITGKEGQGVRGSGIGQAF
jgi:hypothetical protein